MEGWLLDVKQAFRVLRRRPWAALTIIGTVALAVGATTAVYSVVDGVLLEPLPYSEPDRLARLWQTRDDWANSPNLSFRKFARHFPPGDPSVRAWQEADTGFASIGSYVDADFVLLHGDRAEVVRGQEATSAFFATLAAQPLAGRLLQAADDAEGAPRVALLAEHFWRERFAGREVIGEEITLDNQAHTIVGILPQRFQPPTWDPVAGPPRLWTALTEEARIGNKSVTVIGRLRSGVSLNVANGQLAAAQAALNETLPEGRRNRGAYAVSLMDSIVGEVRSTLWFLFGAVALVLVIATVNITHFLTVLGLERRRDLAVRTALGAEKMRLVRGMFMESTTLALLGGLGGILIAYWSLPALLRFVPPTVPRHEHIDMNLNVLLCGLAMSGITAILAGGLPAVLAARARPQEALRAGSRGVSAGRAAGRARSTLVVAEVALAFVLLIGAALLATSFIRLESVDRGFATSGLATLTIAPDPVAHPTQEDRDAFSGTLMDRFSSLPGVHPAVANNVPLSGEYAGTFFQVERPSQAAMRAKTLLSVGNETYFDVVGIRVLAGRGFDRTDRRETRPVAIVNQTMAHALWPGETPLGKRLRQGENDPWREVVGVAADLRHVSLATEIEPKVYLPAAQSRRDTYEWLLRIDGDLPLVIEQARAVVASVSPTTAVGRVRILDQTVSEAIAVPRFRTFLIVGLAGLAAVLALLGVYGILAFTVAQRTHEMGIRIALGAGTHRVVGQVVGTGLKMALAGIAVGVAVAWMASGLIEQFLFQIAPSDPLTLVVTVLLVLAMSCGAAYLLARRAASVDPMRVLRSD